MNTVLRVFAALLGLCLLLPGLCTLAFGGYFAIGTGGGLGGLSLPWLVVGGLVTWVGVLVLIWAFRRD